MPELRNVYGKLRKKKEHEEEANLELVEDHNENGM